MSTVTFDLTAFLTRYPTFAGVASVLLSAYFAEATLVLDPTDASMIVDPNQRALLLNLLTAHIASLEQGTGNGPSGLVGRVTHATQGSTSVAADYGKITQAESWYVQTPYGAKYWALTTPYRTLRYVSGR